MLGMRNELLVGIPRIMIQLSIFFPRYRDLPRQEDFLPLELRLGSGRSEELAWVSGQCPESLFVILFGDASHVRGLIFRP